MIDFEHDKGAQRQAFGWNKREPNLSAKRDKIEGDVQERQKHSSRSSWPDLGPSWPGPGACWNDFGLAGGAKNVDFPSDFKYV